MWLYQSTPAPTGVERTTGQATHALVLNPRFQSQEPEPAPYCISSRPRLANEPGPAQESGRSRSLDQSHAAKTRNWLDSAPLLPIYSVPPVPAGALNAPKVTAGRPMNPTFRHSEPGPKNSASASPPPITAHTSDFEIKQDRTLCKQRSGARGRPPPVSERGPKCAAGYAIGGSRE